MNIFKLGISILAGLTICTAAWADMNTDANKVAIKGYDAVAYFTDKAAIPGKKEYNAQWMDAIWFFASAEHKRMFLKDPEKFAPQYGGYCAYAVSKGSKADTDPRAFSIVDGRLFLNYSAAVRNIWERGRDMNIRRADNNWKRMNR